MPAGKALVTLAACAAVMLTGCATSSWEDIGSAWLSADGRTLTVRLLLAAPSPDAKPCERVTDTEVNEFPSKIVIGIQVEKDCPRPWPWEEQVASLLISRPSPVELQLRKPLAGRSVVNNTSGRHVRIYPEKRTSE
ncbi:hypothetical protein [Nonomuraea candida]|uniref:hypothetical protein n=1 Tax=Nonomuraea candida TaxID=359159 RepID=UPI0012F7C29F|nr:hypothetical protein [Nonomuraea candida]